MLPNILTLRNPNGINQPRVLRYTSIGSRSWVKMVSEPVPIRHSQVWHKECKLAR